MGVGRGCPERPFGLGTPAGGKVQAAGEQRGLPLGFWLALAAGLALRVWYVSDLVAQPWFGYPLVDELTFDRSALEILRGEARGAFSRPPLYPHVLALIYRVAGRSAAAVVAVQAALGLAALIPAYRLGERWFGRRAALGGAWIAACYPLRTFFEGELLDVTLFSFLFIYATRKLWQALEEGAVPRVFLAGLLYGVAALARPNLLLALLFVGVGAALAFRVGWRRLPALAAAGGAGVALALAPVAAHNWRAEGSFIAVAANGGVNFYLGNEPSASGLTPVPPGLRWEEVMLRPIREGRHTLSEQDRWWYGRAAEEIRADPGRWAVLLGRKAALFLNAAELSNNKALVHFTGVSFPVRHYRWWFGILVTLALTGMAARRGAGSTFLGWLTAGFGVSVVLFFVAERYRLPLVPMLAPAAVAGAAEIVDAVRRRNQRRALALGGLSAAMALAVFPNWFGAAERISADFQMGQVFLMRNEPQRAAAVLEKAHAADPLDPDVLNSLGAARLGLGDLDGAEAAYRLALEQGEFGEVWFNLGVVGERRGAGHEVLAAARYRRAAEINPLDPRPGANLSALTSGGLPVGDSGSQAR